MGQAPGGRLDGTDLVLSRTVPASADEVWADVTEPGRTARWFGPWEGEGAPGRTVRVQLAFEDGAPWSDLRIDACEPPHRLTVTAIDQAGAWRISLLLAETGGATELRLVHHLTSTDGLGEIGPGWEYYLDQLLAARDGKPLPSFDDYYPMMKAYYEGFA